MKEKILTLSIIGLAGLFTACSDKTSDTSNETESPDAIQPAEPAACTFSFRNDATTIKWTAFKTTAKVGVSGKFERFAVTGIEDAETPMGVLKNASINIEVASINSNDATGTRDPKILKSFFGVMQHSDTLSGKVVEINDDGTAILSLKMNDVENNINVMHEVVDDTFKLTGILNLDLWNGLDAVASLNKVCKDLHKGEDGVSKLWHEVKVDIRTILIKNCD